MLQGLRMYQRLPSFMPPAQALTGRRELAGSTLEHSKSCSVGLRHVPPASPSLGAFVSEAATGDWQPFDGRCTQM
jgi:hypothetical protein